MVRAILAGTKTQTRRVVKAEFMHDVGGSQDAKWYWRGQKAACWDSYETLTELVANHCPYGQPSEHLWVRETWMPDAPHDGTWASTQFYGCKRSPLSDIPERFQKAWHCIHRASWEGPSMVGWKPSIHMPRWASRISLEVTGVRVERLQDISEADAETEGIEHDQDISRGNIIGWRDYLNRGGKCGTAKGSFHSLWSSINGPSSWDANPWVWVLEFRQIDAATSAAVSR
jgi:hypothetical protein